MRERNKIREHANLITKIAELDVFQLKNLINNTYIFLFYIIELIYTQKVNSNELSLNLERN